MKCHSPVNSVLVSSNCLLLLVVWLCSAASLSVCLPAVCCWLVTVQCVYQSDSAVNGRLQELMRVLIRSLIQEVNQYAGQKTLTGLERKTRYGFFGVNFADISKQENLDITHVCRYIKYQWQRYVMEAGYFTFNKHYFKHQCTEQPTPHSLVINKTNHVIKPF